MDRKSYKLGAKHVLELLKYLKESRGLSWEEVWQLLYTSVTEDTIMDMWRELGL
jgi:hypothetical protein